MAYINHNSFWRILQQLCGHFHAAFESTWRLGEGISSWEKQHLEYAALTKREATVTDSTSTATAKLLAQIKRILVASINRLRYDAITAKVFGAAVSWFHENNKRAVTLLIIIHAGKLTVFMESRGKKNSKINGRFR